MNLAGIFLLLGGDVCHLDGKALDAHVIGTSFDGGVDCLYLRCALFDWLGNIVVKGSFRLSAPIVLVGTKMRRRTFFH